MDTYWNIVCNGKKLKNSASIKWGMAGQMYTYSVE